MSTQNPFFSFFSTHPGGTPLNNPDITQSKGIEIGADGAPGDPLEITDTHGGTLKVLTPPGSVFNQSGRYLHQELNMLGGVHTFGLRANSSSAPFHQWGLTVGAAETLTIDSIKGLISGKEIPEGTSTAETLFAMSGKARANSTCYLRIDGVRQPGLIAVDANGDWVYNTSTQASGRRSYEIEGNYDSGPVSTPPRTVNISQPLSIDTSVLLLDGLAISPGGYGGTPTGVDAIGNSAVRQATGGSPPYTYKSSNIAFSVDQTGYVKALYNGVATITATDSRGAKVSYRVSAANVYQVHPYRSARPWTYSAYMAAQQRLGYSSLTPNLRSVLLRCFRAPLFQWQTSEPGDYEWTVWTGGNVGEALNVRTGQFQTVNVNTDMSIGLGFTPRPIISDGVLATSTVSQDDSLFIVPPPDTAES